MAARKKKNELVVGPVARDPREPEPRAICSVCEASVRENELVPFLNSYGAERMRCLDCDSTARADAAGHSLNTQEQTVLSDALAAAQAADFGTPDNLGQIASLVATNARPEPEKVDKLAVVTAERNRLIRAICDLPEIGLPSGKTMDDASTVLARVPVLIDRSRHAATDTELFAEQVRENREILEQSQIKLADALQRVRDLEVLLGFDGAPTAKTLTTKTEPWMLEIAAGIAQSAPETIDEHGLVLLLVDTLHRAFGHRTVEAGRTMTELVSTPAGAALLAVEEAARHVSVVLRGTPLHPIDLCKDAITDAWQALHVASTRARAAVVNEMNHLIQLELTERERARPKVAPPGAGKQFRVTREPEPAPPPAPVFSDEDDDDDA